VPERLPHAFGSKLKVAAVVSSPWMTTRTARFVSPFFFRCGDDQLADGQARVPCGDLQAIGMAPLLDDKEADLLARLFLQRLAREEPGPRPASVGDDADAVRVGLDLDNVSSSSGGGMVTTSSRAGAVEREGDGGGVGDDVLNSVVQGSQTEAGGAEVNGRAEYLHVLAELLVIGDRETGGQDHNLRLVTYLAIALLTRVRTWVREVNAPAEAIADPVHQADGRATAAEEQKADGENADNENAGGGPGATDEQGACPLKSRNDFRASPNSRRQCFWGALPGNGTGCR